MTQDKITVPALRARKATRLRGERIAMVTAYDATFARMMDQAGVDAMLVGGIGTGGSVTSYRYARRDMAGGGWTALPIPMVGNSLNAVIAVGPNEYLAAGFPGGVAANRFMSWTGTTWVPATNQPPAALAVVSDAAASSDREVFLVGTGGAGIVVIRGRR